MRKRNAMQKNANNKMKSGIMVSHNPFKVRVNNDYNKVLSYYTDILLPATSNQGRYIEMSKKGVYLSLKNNGVAIIKHGIDVTEYLYSTFKKMASDDSWKYSTLMTSYSVDNYRKYLSKGSNRWIISAPPTMVQVQEWNNLENSLISILSDQKFPDNQFPFDMNFSVFKSEPNLFIAQHAHTDSAPAYTYGKNPKFQFSIMVGIEQSSFLDVFIQGEKGPHRVCYNRGDILFVRNDIPHRGCENLGDYEHHRIHVITIPRNLPDDPEEKTQIPFTDFPMAPLWCDEDNKYKSFLN
jgi:hypothetical protein